MRFFIVVFLLLVFTALCYSQTPNTPERRCPSLVDLCRADPTKDYLVQEVLSAGNPYGQSYLVLDPAYYDYYIVNNTRRVPNYFGFRVYLLQSKYQPGNFEATPGSLRLYTNESSGCVESININDRMRYLNLTASITSNYFQLRDETQSFMPNSLEVVVGLSNGGILDFFYTQARTNVDADSGTPASSYPNASYINNNFRRDLFVYQLNGRRPVSFFSSTRGQTNFTAYDGSCSTLLSSSPSISFSTSRTPSITPTTTSTASVTISTTSTASVTASVTPTTTSTASATISTTSTASVTASTTSTASISSLPILPSSVSPLPSSVSPLPSSVSRLPSSVSPLPSSVSSLPSSISPLPSSVSRLPSSVSPLPSSVSPIPSSVSRLPSSVSPLPSSISPVPSSVSAVPSTTSTASLSKSPTSSSASSPPKNSDSRSPKPSQTTSSTPDPSDSVTKTPRPSKTTSSTPDPSDSVTKTPRPSKTTSSTPRPSDSSTKSRTSTKSKSISSSSCPSDSSTKSPKVFPSRSTSSSPCPSDSSTKSRTSTKSKSISSSSCPSDSSTKSKTHSKSISHSASPRRSPVKCPIFGPPHIENYYGATTSLIAITAFSLSRDDIIADAINVLPPASYWKNGDASQITFTWDPSTGTTNLSYSAGRYVPAGYVIKDYRSDSNLGNKVAVWCSASSLVKVDLTNVMINGVPNKICDIKVDFGNILGIIGLRGEYEGELEVGADGKVTVSADVEYTWWGGQIPLGFAQCTFKIERVDK